MKKQIKEPFTRREFLSSISAAGKTGAAAFVGASVLLEGRRTYCQERYSTSTDPFYLSDEVREQVQRLNTGSTEEKIQRIHRVLSDRDVTTVQNMIGLPPRTAMETLNQGGDCTDLSNLVIAFMKEMNISGGALVVQFDGAPEGMYHMIAYAENRGEQTIIDPQVSDLGETAGDGYSIILRLDYDQAAFMYHVEWADYYRTQNQINNAIQAYEHSLEIYDQDPYVHHSLAVIYERRGQAELAAEHYRQEAELRDEEVSGRVLYNQELSAGQAAYDTERWSECAEHFQNALEADIDLAENEREIIEEYRDACRERE